jgi:hypothetical protein
MKFDLHKYAVNWVTAAGHKIDGITTEEVFREVNANLPTGTVWNDEKMQEVEVTADPITMEDAEVMRRIIEEELAK